MSSKLARPIALCAVLTVPALCLRLSGVHPAAPLRLAAFGAAVVAASFLLAWAAEAARVDIAGPLAIAILAVIAVLPEYAVDLYFSYTAGHNPDYVQYAAANMTGSNRLLLGLGWPVVVITSLWVASRRSERGVRELVLQSQYRMELGFLLIASIAGFAIPLISSKVNQWTLLVGSLPLAYLAGGGGTALPPDPRQIEEFLLTATQTLLGVAALLTLRFPRWLAITLLGLFAAQYAVPGQAGRYVLIAVYAAITIAALARNRRCIWPALTAPFRRPVPERPAAPVCPDERVHGGIE